MTFLYRECPQYIDLKMSKDFQRIFEHLFEPFPASVLPNNTIAWIISGCVHCVVIYMYFSSLEFNYNIILFESETIACKAVIAQTLGVSMRKWFVVMHKIEWLKSESWNPYIMGRFIL